MNKTGKHKYHAIIAIDESGGSHTIRWLNKESHMDGLDDEAAEWSYGYAAGLYYANLDVGDDNDDSVTWENLKIITTV